mmetsp:Transcript_57079/g.150412  ORF Transcript_57079/g.150412 Transcript_57079/m.150412 type:complete len:168 (-) Transcript_57079:38-541(-)
MQIVQHEGVQARSKPLYRGIPGRHLTRARPPGMDRETCSPLTREEAVHVAVRLLLGYDYQEVAEDSMDDFCDELVLDLSDALGIKTDDIEVWDVSEAGEREGGGAEEEEDGGIEARITFPGRAGDDAAQRELIDRLQSMFKDKQSSLHGGVVTQQLLAVDGPVPIDD